MYIVRMKDKTWNAAAIAAAFLLGVLILSMASAAKAIELDISDPIPFAVQQGVSVSVATQLIGAEKQHQIAPKETLLDIARSYNLGFNEIADLYPQLDPWVPPQGRMIRIPSAWIPPASQKAGIVVNIAELRLYLFDGSGHAIQTFPLSVGDPKAQTPVGTFSIISKVLNPTWTVPPSLTYKYSFAALPPGPNNPLGKFWLGFDSHYGIHGTDFPWSIGRAVTNGCLRLYPEDIARLFAQVSPGTPVKIIYEPIKVALIDDHVLIEVHQDIYSKIGDWQQYGDQLLQQKQLTSMVSAEKFRQAIERKDGALVDVTRTAY